MSQLVLSKKEINSFVGDIRTLAVSGTENFSAVKWTVSNPEIAKIREFDDYKKGVLVTLLKEGDAVISATLGTETVSCSIVARPGQTSDPNGEFNYYMGDFHAHTTQIHARDGSFKARVGESADDMLSKVRKEGKFDFFTVSDHECLLDGEEVFSVYEAAEKNQTNDFVAFPGIEEQIDIDSTDRYDLPRRDSGEIVTINPQGTTSSKSWEEFVEKVQPSPYTIASLAHPQVLGYSRYGVWNFKLAENTKPFMRDIVHMVEMGQGNYADGKLLREWNLVGERIYSIALDCGFKVSPNCSSDSHGPVWGADSYPGRTIILSPEKSKELFLDALKNARVYASENGNTKVFYTVNGKQAANTLDLTSDYEFNIRIEPFEKPCEKISHIDIVSDYGLTVWSGEFDSENVDITVNLHSETARYFFIRIFSENGMRTWSAPVWTGRVFDECPLPKFEGKPIDKKGWSVASDCGASPETVINGDPKTPWVADGTSATLTVDMKKVETICGFGYYPHIPERGESGGYAHYISDYEYYVSTDNVHYEKVSTGMYREFGGEQIVRIKPVEARWVRLNVLSTTGSASRKPGYTDKEVRIGELDVYSV